ncbi:MAG: hypothetical protein E7256_04155 [Lachnospiraceae bacterium]|nr:hypothetical protein [Lachnospiraceae bacterium]
MAYDEKEERKFESHIWIGLGGFFTVLLIGLTIMLAKELLVIRNGECMTIDYKEGLGSTVIMTEDAHRYYVDLQGMPLEIKDGKLNIYYYKGKEAHAQPQTAIWFWIIMYVVFGGVVGVSVKGCIKHLKPTHHSERLFGKDIIKQKEGKI